VPLPPTIINLPADYWTDRAGQAIVAIVAHGTGGRDSRDTLQHGDGRKVSVHVLITKAGQIYRIVTDERGANHAGAATSTFTLHGKTYTGAGVNRATLGFELENLQDGRDPYPDAQLLAMGWQIDQWRAAHGALPILRHAELDPTRRRDPYQLSMNDMELWAAKAAQLPVPVVQHYTVRGLPVYQQQALTGPVVGYLATGEAIDVDMLYPNGAGHVSGGRLANAGFIDMKGTQT
jgi:N-acetyl-anhydromuramyl-L-alanine amidase AmpD